MNSYLKFTNLLLSAFSKDPLFNYVFKDKNPNKAQEAQEWYFSTMLKYCSQYGNVVTTDDELAVLAWVNGSDFPPHLDESELKSLDKDIAEKIYLFEEHEKIVEHYITENANNYGYVCLLAVDEKARNKGYAKQLLKVAMKQMKNKGLDYCWLTTENPENLSFYKKNGFIKIKSCVTDIDMETYFFNKKI